MKNFLKSVVAGGGVLPVQERDQQVGAEDEEQIDAHPPHVLDGSRDATPAREHRGMVQENQEECTEPKPV